MSIQWVAVAESDSDPEPVEISTEPDGTLLLTSVTAQFPGATGLRFRNPAASEASRGYRGVRCQDGILHPPSEEGWGEDIVYYCVKPKGQPSGQKRKADDDLYGPVQPDPKLTALAGTKNPDETTDLIVLGLPFKTTEETIKEYFTEFGDLMMCQLKKHNDGKSRGYAFIRFKTVETQNKALEQLHQIDDRWCNVKIPESQDNSGGRTEDCKIFVARLSEVVTDDDLKEHFSKFGTVTQVYYPRTPFRGYAFISFVNAKVAQDLIGTDHVLKGISLQINPAAPKQRSQESNQKDEGSSSGGGDSGGYGYYPPHPGYGYPGAKPSGAPPPWARSPWSHGGPGWGGPPPAGGPGGAYPGSYPGGTWEQQPATYNSANYHKSGGGGSTSSSNPYGSRPGGGYY